MKKRGGPGYVVLKIANIICNIYLHQDVLKICIKMLITIIRLKLCIFAVYVACDLLQILLAVISADGLSLVVDYDLKIIHHIHKKTSVYFETGSPRCL